MNIAWMDFESLYDRDYSLKKMTTAEYVRDARWKTLGCSVALNDELPKFLLEADLIQWIASVDWATTFLAAHNCRFDGTVLVERYGVKPVGYICTQALARALLPIDSSSLKNVAHALGLGEKGDALVAGSDVVSQALVDYANNDLHLCREIYRTLRPMMPDSEMHLMSIVLRWGIEATLEIDVPMLEQARLDAIEERNRAIAGSGCTEDQLTSNQKFAAEVRRRGLVMPTKISATTMEETDALAKGDPEFQELMGLYPEQSALWEGRLAAKSNIAIRRAEKFLAVAKCGNGRLAMPLNYSGAHTHRLSGADGLNVQNLTRGSKLRKSICAPKGQVICVVDSAQIELRMQCWMAGQIEILDALRGGNDAYKGLAARLFHVDVSEVTKDQRQIAKVIMLACQYGMGFRKLKAYFASGPMGMKPLILSDEEAYRMIQTYRMTNAAIKSYWDRLQEIIPQMTMPSCDITYKCVRFLHEAVELPNGMYLQYPGLRATESGSWEYGIDKKTKYLYGGLMSENLSQALSRIVVMDQIVEIDRRYRTVSSTHDEGIYLAPEVEADEAVEFGLQAFRVPPTWAPDLPLDAEGSWARNYSK